MLSSSPEQILLQKAEQEDHYLEKCKESPVNRLAHGYSTYISIGSETLSRWTFPSWIQPVAQKSRLLWMHPSTGLPHTRPGSLICIPQYFPETRLQETLLHELIHCWQRQEPLRWHTLYKDLGWRPATEDEIDFIPDDYYSRIRINPDTLPYRFWVWSGKKSYMQSADLRHVVPSKLSSLELESVQIPNTCYLPLPVFEREDKPKLGEASVRWLDLKTGFLLRSPPEDFQTFFGPVNDPEHPAEVAAYSLADKDTFSKYPAWSYFSGFLSRST